MPMSDQQISDEVHEILTRYRLHMHWAASAAGDRVRKYAIWCGDKAAGTLQQVIEPCSHREAHECKAGLIASDIIDLVEKARNQ